MLLLLLLVFACQGCEIEFSKSDTPLVKIDDIADLDGVFYVDWSQFVKNPQCVSNIEVKINNRSSVTKRCDCANVPSESSELKRYLDRIRVLQPPGLPCAVCKVTEIEVRLTNSEENVVTVTQVVDPVKDLFDASKIVQTTPSGKGIDIYWTVLKSQKLKEKCLESVDVYNGNFRIMQEVTLDNPVITMEICRETTLKLKYNFQQNTQKPEVILNLSPSADCEAHATKSTDKVGETVTSDSAMRADGEEGTTSGSLLTLKDATTTRSVDPEGSDGAAHRREQDAKNLSPDGGNELPATQTIMIGSAACAVVILTLAVGVVAVVMKRAKSNQDNEQVN